MRRRIQGLEPEGVDRSHIVFGPRSEELDRRARAMRHEPTPAEALLWDRLRRSGLCGLHTRRQQIIDGYIADFYCHAAALVIEVDGPVHKARAEYDAERDRALTGRGLLVLRIPNQRVLTEPDAVLAELGAVAQARAADLAARQPHLLHRRASLDEET